MKIDVLHALEDLVRIYDSSAKMVFREATDNALDISATEIDIKTGKDGNGKYWISFDDNGPGMNKKTFESYHVIAKSTKTYGKSIGFAGVGAKVYLAVGDFVRIFTETCCGNESWSSEMYRKGSDLMHSSPKKSSRKKKGTYYKVLINYTDYLTFQQSLEDWVRMFCNNALLSGIKISINGKAVQPWLPNTIKIKSYIVKVENKKFPCKLCLCKDDLPNSKHNIEYHINNHFVKGRYSDFYEQIKPEFKDKWFVSVEAAEMADYLKTDKSGFRGGWWKYGDAIEKEIFKELQKLGLISNPTKKAQASQSLAKAFEKLLKGKFAFLNLNSLIGTTVIRPGSTRTRPTGTHPTGTHPTGTHPTRTSTSGFSVVVISAPADPKEGYLDPGNHQVVINSGHPLAVSTGQDKKAWGYHCSKVVVLILLEEYNKKNPISISKFITIQSEFMDAVRAEVKDWKL